MRRLSQAETEYSIAQTMESIATDAEAGKLRMGEDVHPFYRVTVPPCAGAVDTENFASLIAARFAAQGLVLSKDEEAAAAVVTEAIEAAQRKAQERAEKDRNRR